MSADSHHQQHSLRDDVFAYCRNDVDADSAARLRTALNDPTTRAQVAAYIDEFTRFAQTASVLAVTKDDDASTTIEQADESIRYPSPQRWFATASRGTHSRRTRLYHAHCLSASRQID